MRMIKTETPRRQEGALTVERVDLAPQDHLDACGSRSARGRRASWHGANRRPRRTSSRPVRREEHRIRSAEHGDDADGCQRPPRAARCDPCGKCRQGNRETHIDGANLGGVGVGKGGDDAGSGRHDAHDTGVRRGDAIPAPWARTYHAAILAARLPGEESPCTDFMNGERSQARVRQRGGR